MRFKKRALERNTSASTQNPVKAIFVTANVIVLLPITAAITGFISMAPRSSNCSVMKASIALNNMIPVARKNNHG